MKVMSYKKSAKRRRRLGIIDSLAVAWLLLFTSVALFYPLLPQADLHLVLNPSDAYMPPFQAQNHFLGTDHLGRDLFYYLLHSCHTAWFLTFPPLFFATSIGCILGAMAAYWGDNGLKVKVYSFLSLVIVLALAVLFAPYIKWVVIPNSQLPSLVSITVLSILVAFYFTLTWTLKRFFGRFRKRTVSVPIDFFVKKSIELWSTLPKLLLLLLLSTLAPNSIAIMMVWISLSYWVLPCRITRSKVLTTKGFLYVDSAHVLGVPTKKVIWSYIFPSIKGPVLINFCFSASGLLGIGSTLAFLGVGLPAETPSWGKLLATSRFSFDAWWLFLFPAVFLVFSILSMQAIGNKITSNKRI
ncbi:ABC transporter permease [Rufibacter roseus]|uniref:ABC transporter permease n=1 Tax=Rufibacter roseus TaxID=1567108 RepID=A0ABW2DSI0_9BACT|nr:ABC transporter permease [Rufibacter roseus]